MIRAEYRIRRTLRDREDTLSTIVNGTSQDAIDNAQELADNCNALVEVYIEGALLFYILPSSAGLRWAREQYAGQTRDQLARAANVSPRTIGNIERGLVTPHYQTRIALLKALGLPWSTHKRLFGA